jgi:hypothetical protein
LKAIAAILLIATMQGRTLYEDPTRSIRIYGYTEAEGGTTAQGDFEFKMIGKPAVVESRLQGLMVSGPSIAGTVAPGPSPGEPAFIRDLAIDGGAKLRLDSDLRYQGLVETSKRLGTPVPGVPPTKDVAILQAPRFAYVGTSASGTVTIPDPFTMEANSAGKAGEGTFTQSITATGTKGTLQIVPQDSDQLPIRTGEISGPVQVDVVREEAHPGKPAPEVTRINGVADGITFDLREQRTITLRGNVRIRGESGLYLGTSEGDMVVITLDETLKPIRIRVTGDPTKSTLREKGPGGGQR